MKLISLQIEIGLTSTGDCGLLTVNSVGGGKEQVLMFFSTKMKTFMGLYPFNQVSFSISLKAISKGSPFSITVKTWVQV